MASTVPVGSRDRVSGQGCVRMEPPGAGPGPGLRLGKELREGKEPRKSPSRILVCAMGQAAAETGH